MTNEVLLTNIRELCRTHNVTVNSLEKKLGLGTGTISRWNKANPSFDKILAIAQFFHVSIDELAGYAGDGDSTAEIDGKTLEIIEYLTELTLETEEGESFWRDCKDAESDNLAISHLKGMKDEMARMLYGSDENGYYLLEILYLLNAQYDYETQIRLYLIPDEAAVPVLECGERGALRNLYVNAVKRMETAKLQRTAKEKAELQRERILKKRHKAADQE